MCGIAGLVSFRCPVEALREEAGQLRRRLRHRGPDGEGELVASHAVLGHTRLVLRDAATGAQPLRSPDGRFAVTFNGELYEMDALCGPQPSEAAALLAWWAARGPRGLPALNGMFAFFVWDDREREGFLVRDRLGIKPVAYRSDDQTLAFASEAHALLKPRPRAHLPALVEYLIAPCFSGVEHSAFAGIDYLPPGHYLRVSEAGLSLHRWAAPPAVATLERIAADAGSPQADRALIGELRERLGPAVSRALVADAPVGVFLSGGLDSTVLAARARDSVCFSIAFEQQATFRYHESAIVISDDGPYVALAREGLNLRGHDVSVARSELARDLEALAQTNDALPAWEQELSQHHLARAAREHVKAVLVGDAADETHYGYHFLLDDEACAGPETILRRLGPVPVRREARIDAQGRPVDDVVAAWGAHYRTLVAEHGGQWSDRAQRILATTLLVQLRWLPRLLHNGDIHTMRFGLEARVPFGDRELLDVASRVTPRLGLRSGVEKAALREACRGLVPEEIRVRRKSALPKDQEAGETYRRLVTELLRAPPPLVAALVDCETLATWLPPEVPLTEARRAALFRVIGLAHWGRYHGVEEAA